MLLKKKKRLATPGRLLLKNATDKTKTSGLRNDANFDMMLKKPKNSPLMAFGVIAA